MGVTIKPAKANISGNQPAEGTNVFSTLIFFSTISPLSIPRKSRHAVYHDDITLIYLAADFAVLGAAFGNFLCLLRAGRIVRATPAVPEICPHDAVPVKAHQKHGNEGLAAGIEKIVGTEAVL